MTHQPSFPRMSGRITATSLAGAPIVLEQLERVGGQIRHLDQVAAMHAGAPVHFQIAMQLAAGAPPRIIDVEISQAAWDVIGTMAGGRVLHWIAQPRLRASYEPCYWGPEHRLLPVEALRSHFDPLPSLVRCCPRVAQLQEVLQDEDMALAIASDFAHTHADRTPYRVGLEAEPLLVLVLLYAGDELALERAAQGGIDLLELTGQQWAIAQACVRGLRPEAFAQHERHGEDELSHPAARARQAA